MNVDGSSVIIVDKVDGGFFAKNKARKEIGESGTAGKQKHGQAFFFIEA
jgi:hypothetical protein